MMRTWRKYVEESIFKWRTPKNSAQGNLVKYFASYSTKYMFHVDLSHSRSSDLKFQNTEISLWYFTLNFQPF